MKARSFEEIAIAEKWTTAQRLTVALQFIGLTKGRSDNFRRYAENVAQDTSPKERSIDDPQGSGEAFV